jgi:predicted nucleotidyltransferase
MRTEAPGLLPLFRSEMQVRLLALLILQPERSWTLSELSETLAAPQSSVHRELGRAEAAGIIQRDASFRPHRFRAITSDPLYEPLAAILRSSVGVEDALRGALKRPDVLAALIHGSWASGVRRPDSDIDVLVVGDADLRKLRSVVRPIGKAAGRTIDLTVMTPEELRDLLDRRSSFGRRLLEGPTRPLVGDVTSIARR